MLAFALRIMYQARIVSPASFSGSNFLKQKKQLRWSNLFMYLKWLTQIPVSAPTLRYLTLSWTLTIPFNTASEKSLCMSLNSATEPHRHTFSRVRHEESARNNSRILYTCPVKETISCTSSTWSTIPMKSKI